MTEKRKRSLRRTVYALQRFAGAPLVFKNMNQCLRLEALAQIFPDALFIWCRRNPLYTAQSLYRTREALFGDTTRWWSLRPPEYRDIVKQEPLEQVVSQIYHIERHTQEGLDSCYPDNYIVVWYEDTVENPAKQLNRLSTFFSTSGVEIHKRPCSNSHTLTSGNRQTIHDESFNRLRSHVSTLYGASD